MDMTGQYRIAAPRENVWAALNDPKVLKACIPGCEEIVKHSDTEMDATAVVALGPVKAKFKGKVTLSELNKPESYTLTGEGQGGAAGFAKGEAKVKLTPDGDDTILDYAVKASIGGKIAQLGQRLIDGAAKKMADDFFAKFAMEASGGKAATKIKLPDLSPQAIPAQKARPGVPVLDPPLWIPIAIAVVSLIVLFATLVR
jgi:uncharacterized protein